MFGFGFVLISQNINVSCEIRCINFYTEDDRFLNTILDFKTCNWFHCNPFSKYLSIRSNINFFYWWCINVIPCQKLSSIWILFQNSQSLIFSCIHSLIKHTELVYLIWDICDISRCVQFQFGTINVHLEISSELKILRRTGTSLIPMIGPPCN